MSEEPRITLELSLPQVNLILSALGQLPYRDVYALVGALHEQASAQLGEEEVT